MTVKETCSDGKGRNHHQSQRTLANNPAAELDIDPGEALEHAIEPVKELAERPMALLAASLGARPSSMWRCTPSTTTTASSTTKPIASTNPNIESVLIEKPNSGKKTNVPTSETGTASNGMSVARQSCRKM